MTTKTVTLEGFLISLHSPNPLTLQMTIDASKLKDVQYMDLIRELEDVGIAIDDKFRKLKGGKRQRSLQGRFRKVAPYKSKKDEPSEKHKQWIRFSPYPSSFTAKINNLRTLAYAAIGEHCILLQQLEHGKTFLLPFKQQTKFADKIDRLNEKIGQVREEVKKFTDGDDFARVMKTLSKHKLGVDSIRYGERGEFNLRDFRYDLVIIKLAAPTVEKIMDARIREEFEGTKRDFITNAMNEIKTKLMVQARRLTEQQVLDPKKVKADLQSLRELTTDIGVQAITGPIIDDLVQLVDQPEKAATLKNLPEDIDGRIAGMLANL